LKRAAISQAVIEHSPCPHIDTSTDCYALTQINGTLAAWRLVKIR
jgi:hypothetical protein